MARGPNPNPTTTTASTAKSPGETLAGETLPIREPGAHASASSSASSSATGSPQSTVPRVASKPRARAFANIDSRHNEEEDEEDDDDDDDESDESAGATGPASAAGGSSSSSAHDQKKRRRNTYVVPNMPESFRLQKHEAAIKAYEHWKSGKSSLRRAATKFMVDKNMVVRAPTLGKRKLHSRRFFEIEEEDEIERAVTHIVSLEKYGMPRLIREMAERYLQKKDSEKQQKRKDGNSAGSATGSSAAASGATGSGEISRGWAKRFIERHPHIGRGLIVYNNSIGKDGVSSTSPLHSQSNGSNLSSTASFDLLQAWFAVYAIAVQYFGNISPSNLYSVGEVLFSDVFQQQQNLANGFDDSVFLETIAADGSAIDSFLVASPDSHSWAATARLPGVAVASNTTAAGKAFKHHSLDFLLNHFDAQTAAKSNDGRLPRGLIIEGSNRLSGPPSAPASTIAHPSPDNASNPAESHAPPPTPSSATNQSLQTSLTDSEFVIQAAKRNIVVFIVPKIFKTEDLKPFTASLFKDSIKRRLSGNSNTADYDCSSRSGGASDISAPLESSNLATTAPATTTTAAPPAWASTTAARNGGNNSSSSPGDTVTNLKTKREPISLSPISQLLNPVSDTTTAAVSLRPREQEEDEARRAVEAYVAAKAHVVETGDVVQMGFRRAGLVPFAPCETNHLLQHAPPPPPSQQPSPPPPPPAEARVDDAGTDLRLTIRGILDTSEDETEAEKARRRAAATAREKMTGAEAGSTTEPLPPLPLPLPPPTFTAFGARGTHAPPAASARVSPDTRHTPVPAAAATPQPPPPPPSVFPELQDMRYPSECTEIGGGVSILRPGELVPSYTELLHRIGTDATSFPRIYYSYARNKWTIHEFQASWTN